MSVGRADGWLRLPVSDIAAFGSGDLISVARLSSRSGSCPIPVYGGNGIAGYTAGAMVDHPTVILGRVGQKCGVVYLNEGPAWITDNALYARRFRRPLDVRFLALALEAAGLNNVKNRNDLPLITQSILNDVTVAWPESLEEQRHVAGAMADIADLVDSLNRKVSKKRAIKQGLMQQLLTGKTRLPGFDQPWSTTTLGELGLFLKGRGVKRDDVRRSGVPCLRYGELYTDFANYTSVTRSFVSGDIAATALPIRFGDVLFAGSGETREEIGMCVAYVGEKSAVAGGDIVVLRGYGFNPIYLATLANTPSVASQKARAGQGDAVVHISGRALAAIRVEMPPRPEQDAVAEVIKDIDHEIDLLTERLRKARAVQQGMMQQLLSGKIRLPIAEAVA